MKALAWHGAENVSVDDVPGARIEKPTDASVRTRSAPGWSAIRPHIRPIGPRPVDVRVAEEARALVEPVVLRRDAIWSVRRGGTLWKGSDEILPLLTPADPLGVEELTTHRLPFEEAPDGYEIFRDKRDGAIKVVLEP